MPSTRTSEERITALPTGADDQSFYVELHALPAVTEPLWMGPETRLGGWNKPYAEARFRDAMNDQHDEESLYHRTAYCDGRRVGFASLTRPFLNESALIRDIKITLHPDFWNKGIGTFLTRNVAQLGFTSGTIQAIRGLVRSNNQASQAMLQKASFKHLGDNGEGIAAWIIGPNVWIPKPSGDDAISDV